MEKPLVSAVMTAYNAEKHIKQSIEGVLAQTHENIQLIVVDDGSTDNTAETAASFGDPRIELYRLGTNRNIAYATNEAFTHVRGEYVAIIDADDLWYPEKIEKQLEFIQENPQYSAVFTWSDLMDEYGRDANETQAEHRKLICPPCLSRGDWLRFMFFEGNRLCNPSALFTSESMRQIGPHSLFYIQATDMEWWVRFLKKYEIGILEEPLMRVRRSTAGDNMSAVTETKSVRTYNEYMLIRYHFFDDMDDELFVKEFGRYFRRADSASPDELRCEKAFLVAACANISAEYSAPGIQMLEELMNDPKTAALLYEKYDFSTAEIGKATGRHLYNDPMLQELLREKAADEPSGV